MKTIIIKQGWRNTPGLITSKTLLSLSWTTMESSLLRESSRESPYGSSGLRRGPRHRIVNGLVRGNSEE